MARKLTGANSANLVQTLFRPESWTLAQLEN